MDGNVSAGQLAGQPARLVPSRLHEIVSAEQSAATASKMEARGLDFYYGCAGWLAHPWVTALGRAVDTAPGHRASARCDQAASVGGSWPL